MNQQGLSAGPPTAETGGDTIGGVAGSAATVVEA